MSESEHAYVIKRYIELRTRQSALRKKFKELDESIQAQMDEIEQRGVGLFKPAGSNTPEKGSMSTAMGRVHYKLETKYQCNDAEAFKDWICDDPVQRIDAVQMRPVQSNIAEILEAGDVTAIPGILTSSKHRAIFTKPSPPKKGK